MNVTRCVIRGLACLFIGTTISEVIVAIPASDRSFYDVGAILYAYLRRPYVKTWERVRQTDGATISRWIRHAP